MLTYIRSIQKNGAARDEKVESVGADVKVIDQESQYPSIICHIKFNQKT